MIYDKVLNEKTKLDDKIIKIQSQIDMLPEGHLICASNGKGFKWYQSDGHNPKYIPKGERALAEQLAYKKYLSLQLENARQEKKAIDAYLVQHNTQAEETEQAFIHSPRYKELLQTNFRPQSEELKEWAQASYHKNEKNPENLKHTTYSGQIVRSKSEALIDMFLYKNKIPFRYECLLQIGSISVFPDFTIRHPKTGNIFYWEHFGMIDNSEYCKNMLSKLQFYISNGIIPTIHLITTFETKDNPLSATTVEKIVEEYFLH